MSVSLIVGQHQEKKVLRTRQLLFCNLSYVTFCERAVSLTMRYVASIAYHKNQQLSQQEPAVNDTQRRDLYHNLYGIYITQ